MKILFLLSCLEPSGSETYCLSLARAWEGTHEMFWISDRLHFGQTYLSLPISRKAVPGGVFNTFKVADFIRRNKIDLVHSHSRRAHWVAAQAARLTGIPHVTTIHQPLPVHFFSRLFPCLGDQTIAIDEAVVDHLARYFKRSGKTVSLIRNGIELERFKPSAPRPAAVPRKILLLGRLSGGRWKAFQFFLQVLRQTVKTLPAAHYRISGRIPEERQEMLAAEIRSIHSVIAPSTLETVDWTVDLPSLVQSSDGVIAAGRSALESLAGGKPVLLLGEGGVIGLANKDTWPEALRTNLGDHIAPKQFYDARMEVGLRELLTADAAAAEWGRAQVEKYYDIRSVAKDIDTLYQCLISQS